MNIDDESRQILKIEGRWCLSLLSISFAFYDHLCQQIAWNWCNSCLTFLLWHLIGLSPTICYFHSPTWWESFWWVCLSTPWLNMQTIICGAQVKPSSYSELTTCCNALPGCEWVDLKTLNKSLCLWFLFFLFCKDISASHQDQSLVTQFTLSAE